MSLASAYAPCHVRIVDFATGFALDDERLERVTIAPLTAPGRMQAAVFRLEPGGRIARHPAELPQVLAVLEGSARVNGEPLRAGQAVFWARGEEHETTTEGGATAVIIEGEGLEPYSSAAATT